MADRPRVGTHPHVARAPVHATCHNERRGLAMATFAERYGPWAVVAGASEGLGEALARGCASRGLNVVLVARRVELAQQIADDIAASSGVQTRALRADLADRGDLDRILAELVGLDVGLL